MKRAPTHSYPGINLGERHASAHKATEVVTFGFWVFLMSDLVYFGLMFATYITMIDAQAGGPGPHELFDLKSVFAQTLILLTSSLTVGLAMLALKYNLPRGRIVLWFGVTLLLGISFLVLEVRDFMAMAEKGGIPQRSAAFLVGLLWARSSAWCARRRRMLVADRSGYPTSRERDDGCCYLPRGAVGTVLAFSRPDLDRDHHHRLFRRSDLWISALKCTVASVGAM